MLYKPGKLLWCCRYCHETIIRREVGVVIWHQWYCKWLRVRSPFNHVRAG